VTKTVDGVCADCWKVKDAARAARRRSLPHTRQVLSNLHFDSADPVDLLWAVGAAVVFLLVALFLVSEWI
jgi:hypothetical protein